MSLIAKEIYQKAFDTYPSTLKFGPECCKTKMMCNKAVNTSPFLYLNSVPNFYKMCNTAVSENPHMLKYCLYKYKT